MKRISLTAATLFTGVLAHAQCGLLTVSGTINPAQTITLQLSSSATYGQGFLFAGDALGSTFLDLGPLGSLTIGIQTPYILLPIGPTNANGYLTYSFSIPATASTVYLPPSFSFQMVAATLAAAGPQLLSFCVSNTATIVPAGLNAAVAFDNWHGLALAANALDHTPSTQGPLHLQGHQAGPCRTARALAMVHIAMFEAMLAVEGGYQSYLGLTPVGAPTSEPAAIAQAAHDVLASLYPSQAWIFDAALAVDLGLVPDGAMKTAGVSLGQTAATAMLTMRASDGSNHVEPVVNSGFLCSNLPGFWRPDLITPNPVALGANWSQVAPFVLSSTSQFAAPTPPAMTSLQYLVAYYEVYALGGDGITSPNVRTQDQTQAGLFWGYDGSPGLGTPPRLFNQILSHLANLRGATTFETAHLLALANTAMADSAVACWHSKYLYQFWRPTSAIREADPGTGPSGLGDGNPGTIADPNWSPLGAPASNSMNPNFTPPFPAYPSGHATFGGTTFQTLRRFFGTDAIAFSFVSDELNGITRDNQGVPRPLVPRTFLSLSQAEEENGQSRIYLGIHWNFDKTAGIEQGRNVADWVFDHMYPTIP
ncbi:MAG TPA: chloroperoxidase [Planctomycetota bacterium]|nr:chloroperoxidase [Planctomycetota bacterium]